MKWITLLFSYISFSTSFITFMLLHTRNRERERELEPTPTSTLNVTLILTAKRCPHPYCQNFPTRFLSFSFSFPLFLLNLQSPKARFMQIKLASIKTEVLSYRFVELCHQSSIFLCDQSVGKTSFAFYTKHTAEATQVPCSFM